MTALSDDRAPHRFLFGAVAAACAAFVLLGSTELTARARRLPLGPVRDVALTAAEPVEAALARAGLTRPYTSLRAASRSLLEPVREEAEPAPLPLEAAESAPGESEPARVAFTPEHPLRVLLLGDSLMGDGFGTSLEEAIGSAPAMHVFRQCTISTGLTRPDFYSWPRVAAGLIEREKPHAIVGIIGINDTQGMLRGGRPLAYGDERWWAEYEERLRDYLGLLADRSEMLYWMALPPMRPERLRESSRGINEVLARVCAERPDIRFLETKDLIGDSGGGYTAYIEIDGRRTLARSSDGVHMSRQAGKLLADRVMASVAEDFELP